MARITYRKTRRGETITMRADKGEDLRGVIEGMANPVEPAKPSIADLERAFQKARRAEAKAIEALPEKPTKAQSDRCWALAAETNSAREALTKARDERDRAKEAAITAETVTDEQIRELARTALTASQHSDCAAALAPGLGRTEARKAARGRCADLIKARAAKP
jgi:hypothetical protein